MFEVEVQPTDAADSPVMPRLGAADSASLADRITRAAGQLNALNYTFIKMLDEFDLCEGWA